jgi:hypothetical protein
VSLLFGGLSRSEIVVPDDLGEHDQWVLWRYEERNGGTTKVPYQVGRRRASTTDPSTWAVSFRQGCVRRDDDQGELVRGAGLTRMKSLSHFM